MNNYEEHLSMIDLFCAIEIIQPKASGALRLRVSRSVHAKHVRQVAPCAEDGAGLTHKTPPRTAA